MKIDKFTKVILTIIAVNLTILTVVNLDIVPKLLANEPGQIQNLNYGLVPINDDGSITVRLSSSEEIDVNITDISTSDKLNINLADINTSDVLKVDIADMSTSDILKVDVANISTSNQLKVNLEYVDQWAFQRCTVPVVVQDND